MTERDQKQKIEELRKVFGVPNSYIWASNYVLTGEKPEWLQRIIDSELKLADTHHRKVVEGMKQRFNKGAKCKVHGYPLISQERELYCPRCRLTVFNREISRLKQDILDAFREGQEQERSKIRKLVEGWINPMKDSYCKKLMKKHFAEVLK